MADRISKLLAALAAVIMLAAPPHACAQQPAKVPRIGFLAPGSSSASPTTIRPFRDALRTLGWIEGQNVVIDFRFAEHRFERLPELATELVRLPVDVIVAPATPAAVAAGSATSTIPIVMVGVGDPVGVGLVASLARPGGNVTGVTFSPAGVDLFSKQLALLVDAVPKADRVAILSNPENPAHATWMIQLRTAARSLGVQLHVADVRDPAELDSAFKAISAQRAKALLVVADSTFLLHRVRVAELASKYRLPTLGYRELVDSGGLMSYGPSLPDLGRRAATYVDKLLRAPRPPTFRSSSRPSWTSSST